MFNQQVRRSSLSMKKVDQSLVRRCRHKTRAGNGTACQAEVEKTEGYLAEGCKILKATYKPNGHSPNPVIVERGHSIENSKRLSLR